jgi:hypothetical protein
MSLYIQPNVPQNFNVEPASDPRAAAPAPAPAPQPAVHQIYSSHPHPPAPTPSAPVHGTYPSQPYPPAPPANRATGLRAVRAISMVVSLLMSFFYFFVPTGPLGLCGSAFSHADDLFSSPKASDPWGSLGNAACQGDWQSNFFSGSVAFAIALAACVLLTVVIRQTEAPKSPQAA